MENNLNRVPLKTIFQAGTGGFSSKRILGFIGFLVCVVIFIFAFIFDKKIPDFSDLLLTVSASLVGLDSVASIFQKNISK